MLRIPSGKSQKGQSLLEYALLITVVILSIILILSLFGVSVGELYNSIINALGFNQLASSTCDTLYSAGFDKDLNEWNVLSGGFWNGGKAKIVDGQVVLEPLTGLIVNNFTGSDYVINLGSPRLEKTSENWQGFGVSFRSSQNKQGKLIGYMFEIEKKNKADPGLMYFSKWVNGTQVQPPLSSKILDSNFNWQNPGNWSLVIAGDTFTAYINGQPVLTAQDTSYTEGSVGINSNSGTRLFLEDFSIETLGCLE